MEKAKMVEHRMEARKLYAKLCREMRQVRLAGAREELAETEQSLEENLEAMIKQVQRLTWAEQQLRALRQEMGEAQRRLSQEYLKLCLLPMVRKVVAKDGLVEVTTATTRIKHQGEAYRIGRLKLVVDPNGYLNIENLTQAVVLDGKRYDHPYVVEGKLRPVEMSGVVGGMICRGDFGELVEWLRDYLTDYDAQRAYCPVEAWAAVNLDELHHVEEKEEEELPPERDQAGQRLFVQACLLPWQARLAESEKAIAEEESRYETLYNEIHVQQRRIEEIKEGLTLLELGGDAEEKYEEEYDLLCQLPGVREVWVLPGFIEVFTERLYISQDGRRHRIGEFCIDLQLGKGIRIRKLENPLLTLLRECHPHIRWNRPCFGNVERRILKELTRCNFKDVILLCLEFLQSYNPRSVYRDIREWSEATGR